MLVRFAVKNLFSFKGETEFNLLPGRISRLPHHKYSAAGTELLKLSALYGANGAGKTNLIKALALLKEIVTTGKIPLDFSSRKFKLSPKMKDDFTYLGIEFIKDGGAFLYSVKINEGIILEEELYKSGLGKKNDEVLFKRKTNKKAETEITFFEGYDKDANNVTLRNVIKKDLIKPNIPLIYLLQTLSSEVFKNIRTAASWFKETLEIIYPKSKPVLLPVIIDKDSELKSFSNDIMKTFQTGIQNIIIETKKIEEFFNNNDFDQVENIRAKLRNKPDDVIFYNSISGNNNFLVLYENGEIVSKRILLEHKGEKKEKVEFNFGEESDGTIRLMEYLPAINDLIWKNKIYFIDEIESSIHPLLVKELVSKFSKDEKSKGQLVFTTHESNLLDQAIFRQDEIWFAEKNRVGATELYPLSEFKIDGQKEHHTIDIQKGYLNGRYGAIPFLGNLTDLNWHKYHND